MFVLIRRNLDIICANILLQVVGILRPRDREEILSLSHDPRENDLRRLTVLLFCQILEDLDEI